MLLASEIKMRPACFHREQGMACQAIGNVGMAQWLGYAALKVSRERPGEKGHRKKQVRSIIKPADQFWPNLTSTHSSHACNVTTLCVSPAIAS